MNRLNKLNYRGNQFNRVYIILHVIELFDSILNVGNIIISKLQFYNQIIDASKIFMIFRAKLL